MSQKVADLYQLLRPVVLAALADLQPQQRELFGDVDFRLSSSPQTVAGHPQTQPVVDQYGASSVSHAHPETAAVVQATFNAAKDLEWVRAYEELPSSPVVDAFRDNYAYCAMGGPSFRGLTCPVVLDDLLLGVTLMAPGVWYPPHHHDAAELYGVLSGPLQWQLDEGDWFHMAPGQAVVHNPNQLHAMRTVDVPTLTWVLWPGDLSCDVMMADPS